MADVGLGTKISYDSGSTAKPIYVANGTDSVEMTFIDDYSKMGIKVTTAAGAVTYYEVTLTERV